MKVIVVEEGFYAGNFYKAGPKEVEMHEKVAKPFLPPYGNQLSLPQLSSAKDEVVKPAARSGQQKSESQAG